MTNVIYNTATTLSGFIADDDDALDWLFVVDQPDDDSFGSFLASVGALVMGSTTYQWVYDHEGLDEHPEKWRASYADRPTFVFTSRDLPVPEGLDIHLVRGAIADHIGAIAAAAGDRDIWVVGGGDLAGQFYDSGHLTEVRLSIAPVTLPSGAPVLPRRIEADALRLTSAHARGQFVEARYEVSYPRR
ncbi:dihydrofolate reductase family protein [Pseudoclavibacter sp. AY1H1]|uniref:dihydrofolate reductase family protein n=1 Tax=Pseudoclavibacter sp. AY1H1 TaxID=2080584 RepID=UPI000CE7B2B0|nr:dihydrofolate reductase family protein [Pseudoclavibacter sp. AY1H1]PPF40325.1 deaminase [Pseudoclavibacter sp. AY1H1]